MNMKLMMIRTYFGFSSIVNPKKAAKEGFQIFQKVRKKDIRDREMPFFGKARAFKVHHQNEAIDCFELGDPNGPLVFLVHGWDSNAGSMSQIAYKFEEKGYRVITFNLPGHAFYSAGSTNLLECKNAMKTVVDFINPSEKFSVVSHSFGSAVTANALSNTDYEVDKIVFLTNPNKVEDIFMEFKEIIGLRKKAYRALIKHTSQVLGAPIHTLDVSANLKEVNYDKLLLIHDINDRVLPYTNSFQINSDHENVQLITMHNVGHYKMLWNPEVMGRAVSFVEGEEVL
ncbi:alpha/beta fold hydrolase [Paracrocinitomix mangrovi]|uniref:alpha/beta fold hydrolase n=1 Tax=Paracrocinitomix mangrovi TaxID=2862509 RepID=UPI001C8F06E1|nr:alpha/beta hydrolase [Paracrocinitomix mangrovi]UKN01251.1 alpha/beta fold hydrolase [Paracrocinitomix mangrovi]